MKFRSQIQSLHVLLALVLIHTVLASPIESKSEEDQLFSTALKNSASSSSSGTDSPNMRVLRQFVGRLLRALSTTLKNYPASPLSQIASSFGDTEQRRQDRMPASFRFPDDSSVEAREDPQPQQQAFTPSESLSTRTARLAFDGSPYPVVRTGADGKPIRMGTVERVARPTFTPSEQRPSTNFNIPSSASTSVSSSFSAFNPSSSKLVTAASQMASSGSRFNDTRQIKYGKPSTIQSQPLFVTDGPRDGKRGRSLKTINVQGVKIIVGERVPDSPEDKFFTWRNARVIKGQLVPNENADTGFLNDNRNSRTNSKLLL